MKNVLESYCTNIHLPFCFHCRRCRKKWPIGCQLEAVFKAGIELRQGKRSCLRKYDIYEYIYIGKRFLLLQNTPLNGSYPTCLSLSCSIHSNLASPTPLCRISVFYAAFLVFDYLPSYIGRSLCPLTSASID